MKIFKKNKKKLANVVQTDIKSSSLSNASKVRSQTLKLNYNSFSLSRMKNSVFPFISIKYVDSDEKVLYSLTDSKTHQTFVDENVFELFSQWIDNIVKNEPYYTKFFKETLKNDNYNIYNLFSDYRISPRDLKIDENLFLSPFHKNDIEKQFNNQEIINKMSIIASYLVRNLMFKEIVYVDGVEEKSSVDNSFYNVFENGKETLYDQQDSDEGKNMGFKDLFG